MADKRIVTTRVIDEFGLNVTLDEAMKHWWMTFDIEYFRLSNAGYNVFTQVAGWPSYSFEYSWKFTGKQLLQLRKLSTPFYVTKDELLIFDEVIAVSASLLATFDDYLNLALRNQ